MSTARTGLSRMGFAKTFVFPALSIFLVPLVGLAFFLHAQNRFDADARESAAYQAQKRLEQPSPAGET
jgi:hypothetical protein